MLKKIIRKVGGKKRVKRPAIKKSAGSLRTPRAIKNKRSAKEIAPPENILEKFHGNPVLAPRESYAWEFKAAFNAAALLDNDRIHLLYRAIGDDDVSVFGYASSRDGVHFDERLPDPVYFPCEEFEGIGTRRNGTPLVFGSSGGWGGCEDPRLTKIDDMIYLTYSAFNGWSAPRVAFSKIRRNDFLGKKWNWEKAVPISPLGEMHKNWVVFPEKIGDKFAVLHSINPNILIDYFDKLDFDGTNFIHSRYNCVPGHKGWERSVRGVGPPPIQTDRGWLVFYHASTRTYGYSIGAMILDLHDPTKIICRSPKPILEPESWYEMQGLKPCVIYSCGAVVKDGKLYIYYGCADTVVCLATVDLNELLDDLLAARKTKIDRVKLTTI